MEKNGFNPFNNKIALACDHAGFALKSEILRFFDEKGYKYEDFGADSEESVNYADYALKASRAVLSGDCVCGILVCGTGVGMSLAANKVRGIRCVLCSDAFTAELSRKHNNANMLALGGRVIGAGTALMIIEGWLFAEFEGGRHSKRIAQIHDIENI